MNLNASIATLQATISQLSASAELTQKQLESALTDSHRLLQAANESATAVEDRNLQGFLQSMSGLLEQLMQYAPATTPEELESMTPPDQFLERLTGSYQQYIMPMVEEAQRIASSDAELRQWGMMAGLGIQVFNSCSEVVKFRKEMNTREKVYAMGGTILMVAGLGLLIASMANPQVSIPVVACLTIIALGCYLCQKAVKRHKSKEAQKVQESLYKQSKCIQDTATVFDKAEQYPKNLLTFSKPATAGIDIPGEKPEPSIGDKLMSGLRGLFSKKND